MVYLEQYHSKECEPENIPLSAIGIKTGLPSPLGSGKLCSRNAAKATA
jgi:hypothetical protein